MRTSLSLYSPICIHFDSWRYMPECTIEKSFSVMEQQQFMNSGITFRTHPLPSTLLVTNLTLRYSRTLRLEKSFESQWSERLSILLPHRTSSINWKVSRKPWHVWPLTGKCTLTLLCWLHKAWVTRWVAGVSVGKPVGGIKKSHWKTLWESSRKPLKVLRVNIHSCVHHKKT